MRHKTTILYSTLAICLLLCERCQSQDTWPEMRPPGAVQNLPKKLEPLIPFKTDSLLPAKREKDRDQLYLQTLILLNSSLSSEPPYKWFVDPQAAQAFVSNSKIKKKRKQIARDVDKIEGFKSKSNGWKPHRDRYVIDERFEPRFSRIVKNIAWIFDELESAQDNNDACQFDLVFSRNFSIHNLISSNLNLHQLHSMVEAVYAAKPIQQLPRIKVCKTYLTLLHDLPAHSSKHIYHNEVFVLEKLLPLTLVELKTEKEVGQLIEFLRNQIQHTSHADTTLESAKWQFLRTALALLDLRDKDYRDVMKDHSHWNEYDAVTSLRSNMFVNSDFQIHDADTIKLRTEKKYKKLFSESELTQLEEVEKRYRESDRASNPEKELFFRIVSGMTRKAFEREINIQQQRYREIQAACGKPASERGKDLRRLNDVWTIDPAWTKSPILKFITCNQIDDNELQLRFYRRAILCMAVIKKWRMAHDGKPPKNLEEAFKHANAGNVPLDPYDSKQLRMSNSKVATVIYSVGPDLIDNKMTSLENSGNPPRGDLMLSVEFTD